MIFRCPKSSFAPADWKDIPTSRQSRNADPSRRNCALCGVNFHSDDPGEGVADFTKYILTRGPHPTTKRGVREK